jgi:50S ribosomal protein L16 3-hydroxylase
VDGAAVRLDARTRMLYDDQHIFINGESYRAGGRDATLMRRLADQRVLAAADHSRLSEPAQALLADWAEAGWLQSLPFAAPAPVQGRPARKKQPK